MTDAKKKSGLSMAAQPDFAAMSKEEIINMYVELQQKLAATEKDKENYYSYVKSLLRENDHLKSKLPHLDGAEYNSRWSWVTKILYVLKKAQRPLLSSEMIDLLVPHEEGLRVSRYRPQAFSPHLGKAVKHQRIIAFKRGGERGNYYVLPDWIDAEGMLLKQYEHRIFFK
jgi:hypothetical protein